MDSVSWFLIIIAVIAAIVVALFLFAVISIFMTEGGGCFLLIGVILFILGIYAISGGGFLGGVGILLLIIGVFSLKFGIGLLKEFIEKGK